MSQASSHSRAQRVPGLVNVVVALVTLALVAVVALRATASTPPALAEFAPTVQKTIQQAPQEQTDVFGNGAGGAGGGTPTPAPTPTPLPGSVSGSAPTPTPLPDHTTFNACVAGDPPRQIQDPQSPPCIPFWNDPKGNGCNTSMGVTGGGSGPTCQGGDIEIQNEYPAGTIPTGMTDFFNKRFEFYGRRLHLDTTPNTCNQQSGGVGANAQGQRAQADCEVQASQPTGLFAAMEDQTGSGISYADEMAQHKVIATLTRPFFSESQLAARAPYVWTYPMAQDTLQRTFAAWACARLAGGVAAHAGTGVQGKPRVYGLAFTTEAVDIPNDSSVFEQAVSSTCGIQMAWIAKPTTGADSSAQSQQNAASAVLQFKAHNVTSVFFLGDRNYLGQLMQDADAQSYQPEWLVTNYNLFDNPNVRKVMNAPADQSSHMFGITTVPMQRQYQDLPSTWADPSQTYGNESTSTGYQEIYHQLLLLASGIQMAGPNLTPATFQSGMQTTTFPNSPAPPIMPGKVGFAGGSHTMTVDAAEWWWSNTDPGPLPDEKSQPGAFCYVDHGARRSLVNPWPSGDPFFHGPCDSGNEDVT
ncbi:MAG TPA: hypothetical protein VN193_14190 [Candidatus Angelobacter sp.]|jgi:hypothetical protein|nr:hypothetical protein [Candidatus Angelobacter sp.]